ncbi:MAG: trigger factor [Desulfobacteraceae bacterium]
MVERMKTSIEDLSQAKKKINVEVEADEVDRRINEAFRELGKKVSIPGFRPGKVPLGILEGRFSKEVLSDVTRDLVNETLPKALEEAQTFPLDMPVIENEPAKRGESFRYSAVMEVRPSFELNDYLGLEVQKEAPKVTDEDVEAQIEQIRRSRGELVSVEEDRGVQEEDYVVIRYQGLEDGEPIEGLSAEDHVVRVGAGEFHPEFEKRLVGLKKGEETSISLDFEDDYRNPKLAGKHVDFQVKIEDIKSMKLPPLDDDFARSLGSGMDSVEDLREEVRHGLTRREEQRVDQELKTRLINKVAETVEFELPESLVEQELSGAVERVRQNLEGQGVSMEASGLEEGKLREELRPAAEYRVKRMLVLAQIANREDIRVTEEDISRTFLDLGARTGQEAAVLRKFYEENNMMDGLKDRLLEEKTLNYLVDNAKVKEVESVYKEPEEAS